MYLMLDVIPQIRLDYYILCIYYPDLNIWSQQLRLYFTSRKFKSCGIFLRIDFYNIRLLLYVTLWICWGDELQTVNHVEDTFDLI